MFYLKVVTSLEFVYLLVLDGDGDLVGFFLFVFLSLLTDSSWNTSTARIPRGRHFFFFFKEIHQVSVWTHQGFPTQEGNAALDSVICAWPVTAHCCVEFQERSGCTSQNRVTYLERKESEQAIKYT